MLQAGLQSNPLEDAMTVESPRVTEGLLLIALNFEVVAYDSGAAALLTEFGLFGEGGPRLPVEIRAVLESRFSPNAAPLFFHVNIGDRAYSLPRLSG